MRNERGTATLLVLTLLALLLACAVGNSLVLHHLRAELKQVERHQLEKYPPVTK